MTYARYTETPKVIVDLRSLLPEVRDQGSRPLCLGFAASDVNSFTNNFNEHLSVEYLAHYAYLADRQNDYEQGLTPKSIKEALSIHGQPLEKEHPYNAGGLAPKKPNLKEEVIFRSIVSEQLLKTQDIVMELNKGTAMIIGCNITEQFMKKLHAPFIIFETDKSVGVHAMIIVGYGAYSSGEIFFLIKNSWGKEWGNNGYAWLTSNYIQRKAMTFITMVEK